MKGFAPTYTISLAALLLAGPCFFFAQPALSDAARNRSSLDERALALLAVSAAVFMFYVLVLVFATDLIFFMQRRSYNAQEETTLPAWFGMFIALVGASWLCTR